MLANQPMPAKTIRDVGRSPVGDGSDFSEAARGLAKRPVDDVSRKVRT